MAVIIVETQSPEKVRVTDVSGKNVHASVQSTPYRAVLMLLDRCSLEQLRTLEMEHLRQVKQKLAGVEHMELTASPKVIDAIG